MLFPPSVYMFIGCWQLCKHVLSLQFFPYHLVQKFQMRPESQTFDIFQIIIIRLSLVKGKMQVDIYKR